MTDQTDKTTVTDDMLVHYAGTALDLVSGELDATVFMTVIAADGSVFMVSNVRHKIHRSMAAPLVSAFEDSLNKHTFGRTVKNKTTAKQKGTR